MKQKCSILYIASSHKIGGGNSSLIANALSLRERGISSLIIVPKQGPFCDALKEKSLPHIVMQTNLLDVTKLRIIVSLFRMIMVVIKYRPSIVHFNGVISYSKLGYLFTCLRIPTVVHFRHLLNEVFLKKLFKNSVPSAIIFNSIFTQDNTLPHMNIGDAFTKSFVIYNHFDPKEYFQPTKRYSARQNWKVGENSVVVTIMGNLNPQKGHFALMKAIPLILGKCLDFDLKFIVSGEDVLNAGVKEKCETFVKSNSLVGRVSFIGFQKDPSSIYAGSDIIIMPSENEAFGRVAVEAILARKKLVASYNSGIYEIISPLQTPIRLKDICPQTLADGIINCIRMKNHQDKLEQDAQLLSQKFNEETQFSKLLEIYKSLN